MRSTSSVVLLGLALIVLPARASAQHAHDPAAAAHRHSGDSAFGRLQARGRVFMGVDQYTSVHRFDARPDGGRIELRRATDDARGARAIRAHMQAIARAFAAGDFSTPAAVHLKDVPGARTMAARRGFIQYDARAVPRGATLRIVTTDTAALRAIHQFLAFQRAEHRVAE
jgi:hypothetical protein